MLNDPQKYRIFRTSEIPLRQVFCQQIFPNVLFYLKYDQVAIRKNPKEK